MIHFLTRLGFWGLLTTYVVQTPVVLADTQNRCSSLLDAVAKKQTLQLAFFQQQKTPILITLCRSSTPKVFEQFYANLHLDRVSSSTTPKAALTRMKQVTRPEHDVFATGVLALSGADLDQYQLRMRVRINNGEATDLTVNLAQRAGPVLIAADEDFDILLVHAGKADQPKSFSNK